MGFISLSETPDRRLIIVRRHRIPEVLDEALTIARDFVIVHLGGLSNGKTGLR